MPSAALPCSPSPAKRWRKAKFQSWASPRNSIRRTHISKPISRFAHPKSSSRAVISPELWKNSIGRNNSSAPFASTTQNGNRKWSAPAAKKPARQSHASAKKHKTNSTVTATRSPNWRAESNKQLSRRRPTEMKPSKHPQSRWTPPTPAKSAKRKQRSNASANSQNAKNWTHPATASKWMRYAAKTKQSKQNSMKRRKLSRRSAADWQKKWRNHPSLNPPSSRTTPPPPSASPPPKQRSADCANSHHKRPNKHRAKNHAPMTRAVKTTRSRPSSNKRKTISRTCGQNSPKKWPRHPSLNPPSSRTTPPPPSASPPPKQRSADCANSHHKRPNKHRAKNHAPMTRAVKTTRSRPSSATPKPTSNRCAPSSPPPR